MEDPKKELIKEIVDLFEDYGEEYVPGEWESFSKANKKKAAFLPMWLKIAALLLVMLSVWLFNLKGPGKKDQFSAVQTAQQGNPQTKAGSAEQQKESDLKNSSQGTLAKISGKTEVPAQTKVSATAKNSANLPGVIAHRWSATEQLALSAGRTPNNINTDIDPLAGKEMTGSQARPAQNNIINAGLADRLVKSKAITTAGYSDTISSLNTSAGQFAQLNKQQSAATSSQVHTDTVAATVKPKKLNTADFLLAESKNATKTTKKKEDGSKWDFGVEVAPIATQSNINVGGGVTTAYRLSNKFSLSSGVSLLQLSSGKSISYPSAPNSVSSFAANNSKSLTGVDANIRAIDIPIAIVYKLNKHYYTSAGISYFNVLSEKRSNTFSEVSQINESRINPETGASATYIALVAKEVEEPAAETPLKGNSYLGFFNFSIGRRQSLFNKHNILIEPFIKIPIGKLSDEDLRLTNSGIKFQFSF